ncbi:unnamed protein product [Amoebophrya sp. A120]|nr:unnamed protein product [Amoebophrya sp. A120]|eukprot:GSA120T00004327001.1
MAFAVCSASQRGSTRTARLVQDTFLICTVVVVEGTYRRRRASGCTGTKVQRYVCGIPEETVDEVDACLETVDVENEQNDDHVARRQASSFRFRGVFIFPADFVHLTKRKSRTEDGAPSLWKYRMTVYSPSCSPLHSRSKGRQLVQAPYYIDFKSMSRSEQLRKASALLRGIAIGVTGNVAQAKKSGNEFAHGMNVTWPEKSKIASPSAPWH